MVEIDRGEFFGRIGYFLDYRLTDDAVVEIPAIWHASRGSRPKL